MTKQTDRPDNALLNSIVGYSGSLLLHTKGKAVGRLPFQSIRLRNKKEVPANWFLTCGPGSSIHLKWAPLI